MPFREPRRSDLLKALGPAPTWRHGRWARSLYAAHVDAIEDLVAAGLVIDDRNEAAMRVAIVDAIFETYRPANPLRVDSRAWTGR